MNIRADPLIGSRKGDDSESVGRGPANARKQEDEIAREQNVWFILYWKLVNRVPLPREISKPF